MLVRLRTYVKTKHSWIFLHDSAPANLRGLHVEVFRVCDKTSRYLRDLKTLSQTQQLCAVGLVRQCLVTQAGTEDRTSRDDPVV